MHLEQVAQVSVEHSKASEPTVEGMVTTEHLPSAFIRGLLWAWPCLTPGDS